MFSMDSLSLPIDCLVVEIKSNKIYLGECYVYKFPQLGQRTLILAVLW